MDNNTRLGLFEKDISGIRSERDFPMSSLTTFKIGGPAMYAVFPKNENELTAVIGAADAAGLPLRVIGNGSNLLVSDNGFHGVIAVTKNMCEIKTEGETLAAGCGATLSAVAEAAYGAGLAGAEFYYGIPGTVGGALYMNAGAFNGQTSDIVKTVRFFDKNARVIREEPVANLDYAYRKSIFTGDRSKTALSAVYLLSHGDKNEIRELMDGRMQRRRDKQPLEYPSAGSVFKRYDGFFTAQLIDEAGLKGHRVGGAAVSEKHAGFIVNLGGATAKDVLELIAIIKETIYKKNGVNIECEVEYIE